MRVCKSGWEPDTRGVLVFALLLLAKRSGRCSVQLAISAVVQASEVYRQTARREKSFGFFSVVSLGAKFVRGLG